MSTDDSNSRRSKPAQPGDRSSGRVSFDDRGNAIWEWSVATGRFTTSVSTARLKKLEHPGLSLVDEEPSSDAGAPVKTAPLNPARAAAPAAAPAPKPPQRRTGMGYSPYDSGIPAPKPAGHAAAAPAARKKDLRRLGEFFALRKQVERNKGGKE